MRKKGFTLVELMGVIVILGAIALITVPVVRDMINNAKKKAFISNSQGIIRAGNLYYSRKEMMGEELDEKTFKFPNNIQDLKIEGELPKKGEMKINENGDIALAISDGAYCARKDYNEAEIIIDKYVDDCGFYLGEELNGTDPIVKEGMMRVTIDADGTVKKAHATTKWYDYANKQWANVVTIKEEAREKYEQAEIKTKILEEDILTYFVWLPRYKYKLWNVDNTATTGIDESMVHSIDIVFENNTTPKSDGTCDGSNENPTNGCYLSHPAFTFGEEELNGLWIGKFRTGYSGASTATNAQVETVDSSKMMIKPNVYTWRANKVINMFNNAIGMNDEGNIFGLSSDSDTHMLKNTEWGSITYLSYSQYGKDTHVYTNNYANHLTGCGANDALTYGNVKTCLNAYGTKSDNVYNQSTTGNISGIFDAAGYYGEAVMGMMRGYYGNSEFTAETLPEEKYIDIYDPYNSMWYYDNRILGDATGEMGPFSDRSGYTLNSWSAYSVSIYLSGSPWYLRGISGIGGFYPHNGSANVNLSFRISLA